MQFSILGPLELRDGRGRGLSLRGSRQRALLAFLLLHPNERVSTERLINGLWSDDKPATASNALQVHVSNLRKSLDGSNQILVTEPGGYRLDVSPEEIDARRFEALVAEGRRCLARGEHEEASRTLAEGLALWRGRALADFQEEAFAQPEIARLEDLRLAALEDRIEADLALGRDAELVPELEGLVAAHPTRERLRGQLMLALYRTGRQAEALAQFQRARRTLVGELGIEPSLALKALQAAILRQDSSLTSGGPAGPASGAQHTERRIVTALFTSLAPIESDRDLEVTAHALAGVLDRTAQVIERHGGHVLESAGDRVLAVFGIPRAREDDALRALRAAVAVRDELSEAHELGAGIGVETGAALVRAPVEQRDGVAGSVLGEVARLGYAARPGEILLGETTRALTGHALRAGPARRVHGLGPVWRLRGLLPDAPAIPLRATTPFVDRQDELAELVRIYERARDEETIHLVTVLGPAGIGKSRLASEFRARVASEATVLVGRCLPYGDGMTFWPLAEIIEQAAGGHTPSALAERLPGDADARTIAEQIAGALGAGQTARGDETAWAVRRFLVGLAQRRPLVVLLEDLHWAEPTFLDLIDHLADFARGAPIALVCLARPELLDIRPSWAGGKANATSMMLEPLSDAESAALIENLAEDGPLEADSRSRIVQAAGGNPLFIEELVRVNLDRGSKPRALELPPTIQAVLAARLDQLEPAERTVLEAASVVGREFWTEALAELARREVGNELSSALRLLVRKELIRPNADGSGDEAFRFRHLLIRDAAYEAIPKARRAGLHEQFADWLERTAGDRRSVVDELLGFHLEQAFLCRSEIAGIDEHARALAARAADHLAAAGRRAHAREDTPAEISLLERAAKLLPTEDARRLALMLATGDALREVGDFADAKAVLEEASALAAAGRQRAVAACARVIQLRLELQTGSEISLERVGREARGAVRDLERWGDDRWLAVAWELLAWLPYFECRAAEAEHALKRTVEYARRAGDTRQEARALALLFATAVFGPLRVADGIKRCEEVLVRHAPSRRMTVSATRALASLEAMNGNFEKARELIAEDRAISEDLGQPLATAKASVAYGLVELGADDAQAAERELRAGYDRLKAFGERGALSNVAGVLALALCAQGRDREALALTAEAEQAAAPEDLSAQVYWRAPRALALARRGQVARADELAREAVALARRTDFLSMQGDALSSSAEVLSIAGRPDEAGAELRKAIRAYDRKGNRVASRKARSALAGLYAVK